jgi:transcriptional regulator with XRE-family HTH domain
VGRIAQPRTRLQIAGSRRGQDLRVALGTELRHLREDSGLSARTLARLAGVSHTSVERVEDATADPTLEIVARLSSVLGCELAIRVYPGTGPPVRDHLQLRMVDALLASLGHRWTVSPEVPVYRPVRGVIDVVLHDRAGDQLVAVEAHSELRRVEQQVRWAQAKSDALLRARREADTSVMVSRLLLLRNARSVRGAVALAARTLAEAYPARMADALRALGSGPVAWPGAAIVWVDLDGEARLMDRPPRGITLGR